MTSTLPASVVELCDLHVATNLATVSAELRGHHGVLAPATVAGQPVTVVTGYQAGLEILRDGDRFPAATARIPALDQHGAALPVLGVLPGARDALHSAGADHTRYRGAVLAALSRISGYRLESSVKTTAVQLISGFSRRGAAEIVGEFAIPLVAGVFAALLGVDDGLGQTALDALVATVRSTDPATAAEGHHLLARVMHTTTAAGHRDPGPHLASWLLEEGLAPVEVADQLVMLYRFACPTWDLLATGVWRAITDTEFGGDAIGGALAPGDVVEELAFAAPPLPFAALRHPRGIHVLPGGRTVHEHPPLLVAIAGCHTDRALAGRVRGNRAHLGFGAGAHACPGRDLATVIVSTALEQLWDLLPGMRLSATPARVPHPLHPGLLSLPVAFTPARFPADP